MTPILTRRWFLFGTAATIAVAALPPVALTPEFVPNTYTASLFRHEIRDIFLGFGEPANNDVAIVKLFAGNRPTHQIHMPVRAIYRWVAPPCGEIVILPGEIFSFTAESGTTPGQLSILYHDYVDDGPPISMSAVHNFPQNGPPIVAPLHLDNSIEARIARRDAVSDYKPMWEWDDDDWEEEERE